MVDKGEINNSHITNIIKSEIGDALTKLPSNAQEKVIHNIIKNTNEKNLINREEIASESIKNGNISLAIIENWYRGILRASNSLESKLYINEEMLDLLNERQIQELQKIISNIAKKCTEFIEFLHK